MKRQLLFTFLFLVITIPALSAQEFSCNTSSMCGNGYHNVEVNQCRTQAILACWGVPPTAISNLPTVKLDLQPTDAIIYISVGDGPEVSLLPSQKQGIVDISHMFTHRDQQLRIQGITRRGDTYNLSFNILHNDQIVYSAACTQVNCDPLGEVSRADGRAGPFYDRVFPMDVEAPYGGTYVVEFDGLDSNLDTAIYINDKYTGYSVSDGHEFILPIGEYRIGVGVSSKTEIPHGTLNGSPRYLKEYTGAYYEQIVQSPFAMGNFSEISPLGIQDRVRVGVVPIQTMHDTAGGSTQTYTLSSQDIQRFRDQLDATVSRYVEPLTYGLQTWDITFEDIFTQPVSGTNGNVDARAFIQNNLPELQNQYEIIIAYYGQDNHMGAAALSGFIHIPKAWIINNPSVTNNQGTVIEELPQEVALHEAIHAFEQWGNNVRQQWQGFIGLDGAPRHGYFFEGDTHLWERPDYMEWNKAYLRGQVVALNTMSAQTNYYPGPANPSDFDPSEYRFIGVFDTVRNGLGNLHDDPEIYIPAPDTYRIYNPTYDTYLTETSSGPGVNSLLNLQDGGLWNVIDHGEHIRIQSVLEPSKFLHVNEDQPTTTEVHLADLPYGHWSTRWEPVKIDGVPHLRNRWNGRYLALTLSRELIAVTNNERRGTPVENLTWAFIKHEEPPTPSYTMPPSGADSAHVTSTNSFELTWPSSVFNSFLPYGSGTLNLLEEHGGQTTSQWFGNTSTGTTQQNKSPGVYTYYYRVCGQWSNFGGGCGATSPKVTITVN